jgi:hypothetical protein
MATCSDRVLSDAQCASILEDPSVEEPQPVEPQPVGDPAPMPGTQ